MSYQAGDTYPAQVTIRDTAGNPTDPDSLTLTVREPDGTTTVYVYGVDLEVVRDSEGVFHADIPLTATGMWVFAWATTNEDEVEGAQVAVRPAPTASVTFATLSELALLLGRDLTAAQQAQGQFVLELATGLIVEAVDKTDVWANALNPIPRELRAVCLAVAARVLRNPMGVSSGSETLGQYSHTSRYEFTGGGVVSGVGLTDDEARMCRRAVWGASSASAYPISVLSAE
jgi:hypothetical protein